MESYSVINQSTPRLDAPDKATGRALSVSYTHLTLPTN